MCDDYLGRLERGARCLIRATKEETIAGLATLTGGSNMYDAELDQLGGSLAKEYRKAAMAAGTGLPGQRTTPRSPVTKLQQAANVGAREREVSKYLIDHPRAAIRTIARDLGISKTAVGDTKAWKHVMKTRKRRPQVKRMGNMDHIAAPDKEDD